MAEVETSQPKPSVFSIQGIRQYIERKVGTRHYQFFMMFLTLQVFFGVRTCLIVAIPSMTEEAAPDTDIPTYPEWDNTDVIISSFFWGYIIPQIGAGQLSEHFGAKWLLVGSMALDALFNLVIPPMAAASGSTGVIICRVIQGLSEGFLFPCVHHLISRWCPSGEITKMTNLIYVSSSLGIALGGAIAKGIIDSPLGWPVAFYALGGLGLWWATMIAIFVQNSPSTHKSISEEERIFIESATSVSYSVTKKTPWRSILTSLPVWAILVVGLAQCWGSYILLMEVPNYIKNIMGNDVGSNHQLSSLPYALQFIVGQIGTAISGKMVEKKVLELTTVRKIHNSLATFLPAVVLLILAFLDSSQEILAIVFWITAVASIVFTFSAYIVNIIDIAPNHAGTVMGIVNSISNIFSILACFSVRMFGNDEGNQTFWRPVLLVPVGLFVVGGLFYTIFATADEQKWNNGEESQKEDNKI